VPRRAPDPSSELALGIVEQVLDHGIVQGLDQDGEEQAHPAARPPHEHVAHPAAAAGQGLDLELVESLDAYTPVEGEARPPPWLVLDDVVANGTVAAVGPDP
jgi:hypothetical protein